MSASAFLAGVQDLGGRVYGEGDDLRIWAPRGALTPELRAQWPGIKPALRRFIEEGGAAQRRWEAYLAAHTTPAPCSRCGNVVDAWPWDDVHSVLCLVCARRELVAEDAHDPPPPPTMAAPTAVSPQQPRCEQPRRPVPSSGRSHAPRGVHPDDVAELRPCSGGCGRQTFRGWACSACNQRHARIELSKGRSE